LEIGYIFLVAKVKCFHASESNEFSRMKGDFVWIVGEEIMFASILHSDNDRWHRIKERLGHLCDMGFYDLHGTSRSAGFVLKVMKGVCAESSFQWKETFPHDETS
jgi:hypothetical protein